MSLDEIKWRRRQGKYVKLSDWTATARLYVLPASPLTPLTGDG
jgi:hypothetical protein